jgi:hypothetical protein
MRECENIIIDRYGETNEYICCKEIFCQK